MRIRKLRDQISSISQICKTVGVNDSNVRKYLRLCRQYGEKAFIRKKLNSKYSIEIKVK